jgi:hypothetical protein
MVEPERNLSTHALTPLVTYALKNEGKTLEKPRVNSSKGNKKCPNESGIKGAGYPYLYRGRCPINNAAQSPRSHRMFIRV